MPYEVKEKEGKTCVLKKTTGEEMHCYPGTGPDAHDKANKYMAALHFATMKEEEVNASITLESVGPVLVAVGATNRPALPLPPISVIEKEGESPTVRVPFLRTGIFRYKGGDLIITKQYLKKMMDNNTAGHNHHGVSLDLRHKPELGALVWFDQQHGGKIAAEEDLGYGPMLVGYGKPTTPAALELLKSTAYAYASAEYEPEYEGSLKQRLSTDDMKYVSIEQLAQEGIMPEKKDSIVLSAEQAAEYEATKTSVVTLEAKVKELQAALDATRDPKDLLPEPARVQLEAAEKRIVELERQSLRFEVDATVAQAKTYRDQAGNAHSPVMLETCRLLLLGEPLAQGDKTIKLESGGIADVVKYFRQGIRVLLETVPGQVPMTPKTEPEGDNPLKDNGNKQFTEEELAGFWTGALFGGKA